MKNLWCLTVFFVVLSNSLTLRAQPPSGLGSSVALYRLEALGRAADARFAAEEAVCAGALSAVEGRWLEAKAAALAGHKDAAALLEDYLTDYPASASSVQARFLLGKVLLGEGRFAEAADCFEGMNSAELSREERADYCFGYGYCLFSMGEYERARGLLVQARSLSGRYETYSAYCLGYMDYAEGDRISAERYFSEAASNPAFAAATAFYRLDMACREENWDYASSEGTALLDRAEGTAAVATARIVIRALLARGDWQGTSDCISRYPQAAAPRETDYVLGYAAYRQGDYGKAEACFRRVCGPGDALSQQARYALAHSCLRGGYLTEALDSFVDAAGMSFDAAVAEEALFCYGMLCCELEKGYSEEGIEALTRFVALYPASPHCAEAEQCIENGGSLPEGGTDIYGMGPLAPTFLSEQRPLPPISVSSASYTAPEPVWIRAGGGWPSRSLFDIRYSPVDTRNGSVVLRASHDGRYPYLRTDAGEKLRAMKIRNTAGVRADRIWNRRRFTAEAGYERLGYDAYGIFSVPGAPAYIPADRKIRYHDVSARILYGDRFVDMERFNFRFGAEGGYFADNDGNGQYAWGVSAAVGKEFAGHALLLDAAFSAVKGFSALEYYHNYCFELTPSWEARWGIFRIKAGADLEIADVGTETGSSKHVEVFPDVELGLTAADKAEFYAELTGGETEGDYRSLVLRNPYILSGSAAADTHHWTVSAGVEGTLAHTVDYDLRAGYSLLGDYVCFLNSTLPGQLGRFDVRQDDARLLSVELNIGAELVRGLTVSVEMLYLEDLKSKPADSPGSVFGFPRLSGSLGLKYVSDRFYAWAECRLRGKTSWGILTDNGTIRQTAGPAVDLSAGAGCKLSRRTDLFVEAGNLLDKKIYLFNHYPGERLNIAAGLSFAF